MTLTTVFLGHLTIRMGLNVWLASIGAIFGGALLGLFNGALINLTGNPAADRTLSTMCVHCSITLVLWRRDTLCPESAIPGNFRKVFL